MNRRSDKKINKNNKTFTTNFTSSKNLTFDSVNVSNYIDKENQPIVSAKTTLDQTKSEVRKNVLKRLTKVLIEKQQNYNKENSLSQIKVSHNKPKHRTPQMLSVKSSGALFYNKKSVRQLFTTDEDKSSDLSAKDPKPLISHELSKKLKSH